ncbi:hypothetical protein JOE11_004938 [Robbsia andropogonis]
MQLTTLPLPALHHLARTCFKERPVDAFLTFGERVAGS